MMGREFRLGLLGSAVAALAVPVIAQTPVGMGGAPVPVQAAAAR